MNWQDILIMTASIVFSIALVPQVAKGFKEKKGHIAYATSTPTFLGLYAMSVAYISLGLIFSTVTIFITATLWLVLFIQRLIYKTPKIQVETPRA